MFNLATKTILQIEPTTVCGLECPQCARYFDNQINPLMQSAELTLEDVQQLCPVEWVQGLEKMFMCGTYGEPAAAHDCLEIFRWFRKINPNITLGMNTSGSLRNIEWWQELGTILNQPLDYVVFSIDGLEDTNHVYRRNSNWNKIMNSVQAYITAGGHAHWDMLVFEHNKHQIDQAKELATHMGFSWFRTKYTDRPITKNIQWLKKVPEAIENSTKSDQIICHYETTNQAYLSAQGQWFPCCYIGGKIHYPDTSGQELRGIFNSQDLPQDFKTVHHSGAWTTVWKSWNHRPLSVCLDHCAASREQPKVLNKWKQEIQLH